MGETRTATIQAVKEEIRIRSWQEEIKAQQASGMSVREWCRHNRIKENTFYYHLRKVRGQFIEKNPAIVPISAPAVSKAEITIERDGLTVKLPSDIPKEILIALVKELC